MRSSRSGRSRGRAASQACRGRPGRARRRPGASRRCPARQSASTLRRNRSPRRRTARTTQRRRVELRVEHLDLDLWSTCLVIRPAANPPSRRSSPSLFGAAPTRRRGRRTTGPPAAKLDSTVRSNSGSVRSDERTATMATATATRTNATRIRALSSALCVERTSVSSRIGPNSPTAPAASRYVPKLLASPGIGEHRHSTDRRRREDGADVHEESTTPARRAARPRVGDASDIAQPSSARRSGMPRMRKHRSGSRRRRRACPGRDRRRLRQRTDLGEIRANEARFSQPNVSFRHDHENDPGPRPPATATSVPARAATATITRNKPRSQPRRPGHCFTTRSTGFTC